VHSISYERGRRALADSRRDALNAAIAELNLLPVRNSANPVTAPERERRAKPVEAAVHPQIVQAARMKARPTHCAPVRPPTLNPAHEPTAGEIVDGQVAWCRSERAR
jgi:hypothetical protein